jgi:ketosteroid isomerase-like protein
MSSEDDVRAASQKFYGALNKMANGDSSSMAEAWSHGASVTTMHPIGGRQLGWEAVAESFAQVAKLASGGKVALTDQLIQVVGEMAYEMGVEDGDVTLGGHPVAIDHRVTNVYRREDGDWRMVHHHVDTSPAMLDVLAKLQASGG